MDERVDGRMDVGLAGDRRTDYGPAGHLDNQAFQEMILRSPPPREVSMLSVKQHAEMPIDEVNKAT
jgi:hypothetical protein